MVVQLRQEKLKTALEVVRLAAVRVPNVAEQAQIFDSQPHTDIR
jgi:hypothetical protein